MMKNDLEIWQQDILEYTKREQRKKEIDSEKTSQEFINLKDQMKDAEKVFDEQIAAIETALKSIEEISKTAPNIQS